MKEICLQAGPARDQWVDGDLLFLRLEFTDTEMSVTVKPGTGDEFRIVSRLWSHTVFELENLAMGLRVVALDRLRKYKVPSRDTLIGPYVHLFSALSFELGHPGIGVDGHRVNVYASSTSAPLFAGNRKTVDVHAICHNRAAHARLEVEDVLQFAEAVYAQAKALAPEYASYETSE